jgi:DNA-binding CsgD family transcriptional regulator
MNPNDPIVLSRQQRIRDLLWAGKSISEVSKEVGISRKRVYDYAEREALPYNPPIRPGGNKERSLIELTVAGFTSEAIGEFFRMSPAAVQKALSSAKERIISEQE